MTPETAAPFSSQGMRLGIFVIAYNAESHIEETLRRIPQDIWDAVETVYVIDDCSTDETVGKTLELKSKFPKLTVIRNPVNQMYGGNQKRGYQYAIDKGLDAVVMLHADGQYAPEYLGKLFDPIVRGEADVVFGSRMAEKRNALKGRMPFYKFIGNIVLTRIQNFLSGMNLSEFHSGYRAYSTKFLKTVPFWENTNGWYFDTEILFQTKSCGGTIKEVSIPTYYGSEICHVNGIAYGINCILTSLKYFLFRSGIFYSKKYDIDKGGVKYHEKFNDPFSSHSKILAKLKNEDIQGKKILELGVGDSSLTKRMSEMGAVVDAVEFDPALLEGARQYCRNIYAANLEEIDKVDFEQKQYDIILAADVLEHLRDPEIVLAKLKRYLKKDGLLVVSLPNVANIHVRMNILLGRFPYHTKGTFDKTHLRFYTLVTAKDMLTKTGWQVLSTDVTSLPLGIVFPFLLKSPWKVSLNLLHAVTRLLKGLLAYQGIYYCINPNQPDLL